jgi:serine O-acetyltransferase
MWYISADPRVGGGTMLENVRADIAMAGQVNVGNDRDRRFRLFFQPGTIAVLSYRFCHLMRGIRLPVLRNLAWIPVMLVRGLSQLVTGVHISSKADIGPGFVVHTVYGIFIPPTKIGANCTVQTGVVLGYGVRSIGDNVVIGSGAKIVGPITIGNNVLIAPNSLVLTNVPDNTTVAGVPARISIGRSISTLVVLDALGKSAAPPRRAASETAPTATPEREGASAAIS